MIFHIENKQQLDHKLNRARDKLVVIDFFATWCGPCKMISPKLHELSESYPDAVMLKVDVDECDDIAQEYNITSMPTFLFIKNNKIIDVFVGGNADQLTSMMEKLAGEPGELSPDEDGQDGKVEEKMVSTKIAVEAATCERSGEH